MNLPTIRRNTGLELLSSSCSDEELDVLGQNEASTEDISDQEMSPEEPLIKVSNSSIRHHGSNTDFQHLSSRSSGIPHSIIAGNQRNGNVIINIPDELNDTGIPLVAVGEDKLHLDDGPAGLLKDGSSATEIHRYKTKKADSVRTTSKAHPYPRELKKTATAALFALSNFVATATSLSVIHESVPKTRPLPDHILDYIPYQPWALEVSEILISVQVTFAFLAILFHPHRFIVIRRVFLIQGLLYGYRAVTMFVTVLPPSDQNYICAETLREQGQNLTVLIVMKRAVTILSGFGLSMNGKHVYCGDYIFSGHTMTLILAYLVIQEYTSRRLFILHWMMWLIAISGVGFLLVGRGHYTIDVIVAYWITTRLWYIYHSMTCQPELKKYGTGNYFTRIWWWCLFRWFEENVRPGPLPSGLSVPLSRKICKCLRFSSRDLVNETSRLTRRKTKMRKQEA